MLVTTIWVLFVTRSFAKDLAPHAHQQILNENAESRTRMAYYDSTHMSNPHYKINFIYKQKTNEVTEIEQIEEEIGKYMHHHHRPPTTTTTTEAQQNIEVVNEKDIEETRNHSPSETPITIIEKHHHKHEKKEVTSTLAPMPPAPKLRLPFVAGHPHFPAALPAKVKNELKELLAHELRRIPHRHPDHRLHMSWTTSESPVEVEPRTELSSLVTQSDAIPNIDVPESHLDNLESPAQELRPITHRHLDHRYHDPQTTSEAQHFPAALPAKVKNELKELLAHELRRIPHRHPDHRLHISWTTSESPVEEEAQTELSRFVTQSEEIPYYHVAGSHSDHQDSPVHELRPTPHRHPDHRLHISRITSEAPVEEETRTELSPLVTQSDAIPNSDVPESHLDHPESPAQKLRPITHRHPDYDPQTTSEAPVEEEAQSELSRLVTQSEVMGKVPNYHIAGSHSDHQDSPAHELRPTLHRHPDRRLHISRTTSEAPVEEEARTELSPPATQWEKLKEIPNNDVPGSHLDHRDTPAYEPRPISHRHPDHRLHISRTTSEAPIEVEARTNHASTEKGIHLSPTSYNPLFLSRKDQNTFAKIRPKFEDVQHGSIGLPSRPQPVYRGSYKFSWDDINDVHVSAVPKVSQLKENPIPPPVPTLTPWYDGYGK